MTSAGSKVQRCTFSATKQDIASAQWKVWGPRQPSNEAPRETLHRDMRYERSRGQP